MESGVAHAGDRTPLEIRPARRSLHDQGLLLPPHPAPSRSGPPGKTSAAAPRAAVGPRGMQDTPGVVAPVGRAKAMLNPD
jgi:hypothetical protein